MTKKVDTKKILSLTGVGLATVAGVSVANETVKADTTNSNVTI